MTPDPTAGPHVPPKVAVIYYSATGNVHRLAGAVVDGAERAGAAVRLRRVAELMPRAAVESDPRWSSHLAATAHIAEAHNDDLIWADALVFGTPARYGNVAAQLKLFLDSTGPLWKRGLLAGKLVSAFVSTTSPHGGQESSLLALYNTFYHWGCLIAPPGYTGPEVAAAGGNPYGASAAVSAGGTRPAALAAARFQGARMTALAARLQPAPAIIS